MGLSELGHFPCVPAFLEVNIRKCVVTRTQRDGKVSKRRAGAGCQEKQKLPAKGEVFLLDIPFYRTRPLFAAQSHYWNQQMYTVRMAAMTPNSDIQIPTILER